MSRGGAELAAPRVSRVAVPSSSGWLRAAAVLGAAALFVALTYVWWDPGGREAPPSSGEDVAEVSREGSLGQAPTRTNAGEIDRLIRAYEARVKTQPNVTDFAFLGRLYFEKGRLTGDVATYARAEEALQRALDIYPEDPEARSLLASVKYTSHDFPAALRLAGSLYEEDRSAYGALAVMGDSQLELGLYPLAAETYGLLAQRLPSVPAVDVRASRLAFLNGDVDEARRLAQVAGSTARSAGLFGAGLAWYRSYRGQLEFEIGDYRASERLYESALRVAPRYHVALFGLGRAQAALGHEAEAIRSYRRAVNVVPNPEYLAALGDLYRLKGSETLAVRQYETVALIASLAEINEQVFNRQLVLFQADHDVDIRQAVRSARAELAVRKDIYGYDAYAWALFKNGDIERARVVADRALRLGTQDARLLYHSGMISAALGDEERARAELEQALALSPRFDPVQSEVARAGTRPARARVTTMRFRRITATLGLTACLLVVAPAPPASAHPLGNFTINQFSRIEAGPDHLDLHYVVDMAEIPTFQEINKITDAGSPSAAELQVYADGSASRFLEDLTVLADGTPVELAVVDAGAELVPGEGGLVTLRIETTYTGSLLDERTRLEYTNENYANRLGWKEIVAGAVDGQGLERSSVANESVSNELRSYPEDLLTSPLEQTSAELSLRPGAASLRSSGRRRWRILGSGWRIERPLHFPDRAGSLAGASRCRIAARTCSGSAPRPWTRSRQDDHGRVPDRGRREDAARRHRRDRGLADAHVVRGRPRAHHAVGSLGLPARTGLSVADARLRDRCTGSGRLAVVLADQDPAKLRVGAALHGGPLAHT